jgi:hypothetical protein
VVGFYGRGGFIGGWAGGRWGGLGVDFGEALAHYVLEGDGLGTDKVGGPEFEDAEPVVIGELEGVRG